MLFRKSNEHPTRIGPPHRVAIPILIRVQRVGARIEALKWIASDKNARRRIIPPRPQVLQAAEVQFARKAERLRAAHGRRAEGAVVVRCLVELSIPAQSRSADTADEVME
jgi:hypothetical protein